MPFIQAIPVDIIALLAALTMSSMSILNRQGLRTGSPYMAAVIINATVFIFYFITCTAMGTPWTQLPPTGVMWFLVAGISSPALSMTIYYYALSRFGVAQAAPIAMGANPLSSVVLAVILLGERPSWSLYVGTVLIIGGIWVITRPKGQPPLKWTESLIPLTAGFFWGLTSVIRKIGLSYIPAPQVGIVISSTTALAFLALTYWFFPKDRRIVRSWRAAKFSLYAGLAFATTLYFLFSGLALGQVSRVMAIMGIIPLCTIAMTALFLGDLEKVTGRTYGGTVAIVIGVVTITLLK